MSSSLGQIPTFSCQQLVMKLIVMDDRLWMKNHLVSNNNGNIVHLEYLIYKKKESQIISH